MAEREGFEPPVADATPVFKTGSFDHSDTAPREWNNGGGCYRFCR